MTRITSILTLALVALFASTTLATAKGDQPTVPADAPRFVTLTSHAVVEGNVVHLGDLFQGTGEYAERVIAYAPRPGSRAVFDARWLKRVAAAFKLDWQPSGRAERAVVERASQVVTKADVETLLQNRLIDEGGDANTRAVLSNRAFRLHLPLDADGALKIEQLVHNSSTGRFTAIVAWGNGADERSRLTGKVERMVDVPVPSERVMRGDIIDETDLQWVSLPQARVARGAVVDAERLIGMAAKRGLQAGKPVSDNDIRRPLLVNRGETVTMQLTTPMMRLTAKGRALQSGSRGDTIRISNLQTNTVVDAIIIGPGQARVETFVTVAMR